MRWIAFMTMLAVVVGACAKSSDQIAAAYISPLQYESYNCTQISQEVQRLSARASRAAGAQDQQASKDAVAMGVGLDIFWPTLLMVGGDGPQAHATRAAKGRDGSR